MIKLSDYKDCTGCAACYDACKRQAISMVRKKCFDYPEIDSSICVECEKCTKICPVLNPPTRTVSDKKAYYGYALDKKTLMKSSSGGLSTVFYQTFLKQSTNNVVYGVRFNDKGTLEYSREVDVNKITGFVGSKYLQAESKDIYTQVKSDIKNGKHVLFTALPCVMAGMENFLNEEEKRHIVFVKIICHGISSQYIFKDYCKYIERKYRSTIKSYNFRSKILGWERVCVCVQFENNKKIKELAIDNIHHHWFGIHYNLRESCFNCKHRTIDEGDLIIGDFWGHQKIKKTLNTKDGLSVVIVNNDKGVKFLELCKPLLALTPVDINTAIDKQTPLWTNPIKPEKHDEYIEDAETLCFDDLLKKYHKEFTVRDRIRSFIFGCLSLFRSEK